MESGIFSKTTMDCPTCPNCNFLLAKKKELDLLNDSLKAENKELNLLNDSLKAKKQQLEEGEVVPEAINITHLVGVSEERGVVVQLHLLEPHNKEQIAALMKPCVESAYVKKGKFVPGFLDTAYFALTITKEDAVIATLAAYWLPCPANTFETRFESVHKDRQRQGYGAMLFRALDVAGLYLAKHDPFIAVNLAGCTTLAIHAYVDVKKKTSPTFWHKDMMLKWDYEEIDIVEKEHLMEKILDL